MRRGLMAFVMALATASTVHTATATETIASTSTSASRSGITPPRVLLFQLGDDYGFNNVGYPHGPLNQGNPEMMTPTMDELAMSGIRLERHYVYKYCSPTRSAFLTGRLPVHVNQNNACNDARAPSGADLRMTLLPQKLKSAGYTTAIVGKWHCGARSAANLPVNRGFDFHLGFLKGGEDHFHQNHCAGGPNAAIVDLWTQHAPARGLNDTYSAFLYTDGVLGVIDNFTKSNDPNGKLFIYLPWHNTHDPLEAPDEYMYPPYYNNSFGPRMTYNAMARALDQGMHNITSAIKTAGLWNETLVFFSADNGGWLLPGGVAGSSNWPLRGGKVTDFEGGVRGVSFLSGGYLPESVRGSRHHGYMSIADWYATLCYLAGVDPTDHVGDGVPDTDSINMWDSLMMPNTSTSPRTMLPLSWNQDTKSVNGTFDRALIVGPYKIICGTQDSDGFWQGPVYPNGTDDVPYTGCADQCCLFNIQEDETEAHDLRLTEPDVFANMSRALDAMGATYYQTNYSQPNTTCITDAQAESYYGGFIGPVCFETSPFPPSPPPPPPRRMSLSRSTPSGGRQCLHRAGPSNIVAGPCTESRADSRASSESSTDMTWVADASQASGGGPGWLAYEAQGNTTLYYIKLNEHTTANVSTKGQFCIRGSVYLNADAGVGTVHHQGYTLDTSTGTMQSTICTSPQYMCLNVPFDGATAASGGPCDSNEAKGWVAKYADD
eukprot:m.20629 g.20629  ORF g.20629 m.20629 type:complete len:718 (-) comp3812_c0_seq1:251-2404(-)